MTRWRRYRPHGKLGDRPQAEMYFGKGLPERLVFMPLIEHFNDINQSLFLSYYRRQVVRLMGTHFSYTGG